MIGESFASPFLLSAKSANAQTNVIEYVSGAIQAATVMILAYDGLLVVEKSQVLSTSGVDAVPGLSWLRNRWTVPSTINPAMIRGLLDLAYVDASFPLEDYANFRYGWVTTLRYTASSIPIVSKWATTLDNFAVELLGISAQGIQESSIDYPALIAIISAHAPQGTRFIEFANDPFLYRPILVANADLLLSQLLYALARQPQLRQTIHKLYVDQIANSGILRVEPVGNILQETSGNLFAGPTKQEFSRRLAAADIGSVYELLGYEIGPTFLYPLPNKECPTGPEGVYLTLLESMLYFVLFPKSAKFIAYELCNRIRDCLKKLNPSQWSTYVRVTGYIHGLRGSDTVLQRSDYLYNVHTPSMLYGPAENLGWNVVAVIASLILPIGQLVARDGANNANLPSIDGSVFLPWDDPGEYNYSETELGGRLLAIMDFMQTNIIPLIRAKFLQSGTQISALATLASTIESKANRLSRGLGRGVRRLMRQMVDYATNVIQSYDGSLASAIPGPIALFDLSRQRSQPLFIQSVDSDFIIDTKVVWTLMFHIGYSFDCPLFLSSEEVIDEVRVRMEPPQETAANHMGVYAYAEKASIAAGLIGLITDDNMRRVPPVSIIYDYLRLARVGTDLLSSNAYKALERIIQSHLAKECVGRGATEGLPDIRVSGDYRFGQPAFRRASQTLTPMDPEATDPGPLRGVPSFLCPRFRDMFVSGLRAVLDPRSALARLGTGLGFYRRVVDDLTIADEFIPPDGPEYNLDISNFHTEQRDNRIVTVFRVAGIDYTDPRAVPTCTFICLEPGALRKDQIMWVTAMLEGGRVALKLPNAKYIYTLKVTDREGYESDMRHFSVAELLATVGSTIISVVFYTTRAQATDLCRTSIACCVSYVI